MEKSDTPVRPGTLAAIAVITLTVLVLAIFATSFGLGHYGGKYGEMLYQQHHWAMLESVDARSGRIASPAIGLLVLSPFLWIFFRHPRRT